MITLQVVTHPGWLTTHYESGDVWFITHGCVSCGHIKQENESLLDHTRREHPAHAFALELHNFRGALTCANAYYGLEALQWPDVNGRRWAKR